MSDNPFMVGDKKPRARTVTEHAQWDKLREAGMRKITDAGIKVGDLVTVSWKVDPAYGGGTQAHTGIVESLDSWLYIASSDRSPGHLKIPLSGLHHVTLERSMDPVSETTNPFMMIAPAPTNPFMI